MIKFLSKKDIEKINKINQKRRLEFIGEPGEGKAFKMKTTTKILNSAQVAKLEKMKKEVAARKKIQDAFIFDYSNKKKTKYQLEFMDKTSKIIQDITELTLEIIRE